MPRHRMKVAIDYHQFYLWDAGTKPEAPTEYTDEDVARMVKVAPHVLVVQPVRLDEVPVEVGIHDADPGFDAAGWDHVVECSLALPTGHLQVHECLGTAVLDTEVAPGTYAARVLFRNLDSIDEDGYGGDDAYHVDLWPGEERALEVVKQRA